LKHEGEDRIIHVLVFESESYGAIHELIEVVSKEMPSKVNVLSYRVDDTLLRLVLASLREGAALSGRRKK